MKLRMHSNPMMMIEHYGRISNWSIWFIRFWNHMLMPHLIFAQNLWIERGPSGITTIHYISVHMLRKVTEKRDEKNKRKKERECIVKRFNRNKTDEYDNMKRKRINRPYAILASNWLCTTLKILYFNTNTIRKIRQS